MGQFLAHRRADELDAAHLSNWEQAGAFAAAVLSFLLEGGLNERARFEAGLSVRRSVLGADYAPVTVRDERVKVHHASLSWEDRLFQLDGVYRSGHYHWGYEGDFFGLYRDAYYGLNTDVYDADAPVGFEVAGKRALDGVKLLTPGDEPRKTP